MKTYLYFIAALTNVFFFNSFAQGDEQNQINSNEALNSEQAVIVSYHVEERVNMGFGSQITTYNVSDLRLVSTKDLGPNNIRIVTPKYGKQKINRQNNSAHASPVLAEEVIPVRPTSVNINIIATYERILEKGYRSEKMLKSVANEHFFNGDLDAAAKWYTALFALNTNLESDYYYRYAKALASVNQLEKSNAMMKIFETKNL